MAGKPQLQVTVFSDYICPFCYVGHHRLNRLKDTFDLKINWLFVEIHPETAAEGVPVSSLEYPSEHWDLLMKNLEAVATEEGITMAEHTFTTNSKDALLLAEASKSLGKEIFYLLHEKLFEAFFVDAKNIGDKKILQAIAKECGVTEQVMDLAWNDEKTNQKLLNNYQVARKYDVQSVPSFVFGEKVLNGVVKEETFRAAADELLAVT